MFLITTQKVNNIHELMENNTVKLDNNGLKPNKTLRNYFGLCLTMSHKLHLNFNVRQMYIGNDHMIYVYTSLTFLNICASCGCYAKSIETILLFQVIFDIFMLQDCSKWEF